jgi:hypothetical protein
VIEQKESPWTNAPSPAVIIGEGLWANYQKNKSESDRILTIAGIITIAGLGLGWFQERDRRYEELNVERQRALAIKEKADDAALSLQRQYQTYKDEQANNLRAQIGSERGNYVTQADHRALQEKVDAGLASVTLAFTAQLKPVSDYILSQQGAARNNDKTVNNTRQNTTLTVAIAVGLGGFIISAVTVIFSIIHAIVPVAH